VNKGGRYVIAKRAGVDSPPYASNWMPLWAYSIARSLNNATRSRAAANALATSGLVDVGGVFVSLESASGQQWDWPNAFAPLQSFLYDGIMGTTSSDDVRARELASVILHRWIKASMNNFLRDGILNEKNDARFDSGISGRGGEYQPQLGFGWSIGVSLDFIFQMMNETENPRNFGRKLNLTNNLQK
jgi:alpha,alpha-trehalase